MSQTDTGENRNNQLPIVKIEPSSLEQSPESIRKDMYDENNVNTQTRALTPADEVTEEAKIVLKCVLMKRCFSSNDVESLPNIKETDIRQHSSNDALSDSSREFEDKAGRRKKSVKKRVIERLRQAFKKNRAKDSKDRRQTAPIQKSQTHEKDRKIFNHVINALKPKKFGSIKSTKKRSRSDETMFRIDNSSSAEQQQILANYMPEGKVHSLDKNHRFEVKRDFAQSTFSQPPVKAMPQDLRTNHPQSFDDFDGISHAAGGFVRRPEEFCEDFVDSINTNHARDSGELSPCFAKKGSFHDLPKDKQDKLYAKIAEKVLEIGDDIQRKHFERKRSLSTSCNQKENSTENKRRNSIPNPPTSMHRRFRSPSLEMTVNNIVRSGSYSTFQNEVNRAIDSEQPINQVAVLFNITSEAINTEPSLFKRIKDNCIRFFQDKLSGMIASQGGWESVVEDSSGGEVD